MLNGAQDLYRATTDRVRRQLDQTLFDRLYVDVIVRRYEAATGNHGVLVETGEILASIVPP